MKKSIRDAEILEKVLEKYTDPNHPTTWTQGVFTTSEIHKFECLLGAVASTVGIDILALNKTRPEKYVARKRPKIIGALYKAIEKLFPNRTKEIENSLRSIYPYVPQFVTIYHFNDFENTTFKDIQQVLKEASFNLRYGDFSDLETVDNEGNPQ